MSPPRNVREVAAAIKEQSEPLPELPPSLVNGSRPSSQLAHEIICRYLPNLADVDRDSDRRRNEIIAYEMPSGTAALNLYGMAGGAFRNMSAAQQDARQ